MMRMHREPLILNVLKNEGHAAGAEEGAAVAVDALAAPRNRDPDHLAGPIHDEFIQIKSISLGISPHLPPLLFFEAIKPADDSGNCAESRDVIGKQVAAGFKIPLLNDM